MAGVLNIGFYGVLGFDYTVDNTYKITAVDFTKLPVTVEEARAQLRLPPTPGDPVPPEIVAENLLITGMIIAATQIAEYITHLEIFPKDFLTTRNSVPGYTELRKTPFRELISMDFLVNETYTAQDIANYRMVERGEYSYLYPKIGGTWGRYDTDIEAMRIAFSAGYEDPAESLGADMKLAILQHVTSLYENRGDCDCSCADGDTLKSLFTLLPAASRLVYRLHKVMNINGSMY